MGGGWVNFKAVEKMVKAGIEALGMDPAPVVDKTALYRLFRDSGKSFRQWVDNATKVDADGNATDFATRATIFTMKTRPPAWTNHEAMNIEFLFSAMTTKQTKKGEVTGYSRPVDALIHLGPVEGHYKFTAPNGDKVDRPSSAETMFFWNWDRIIDAKIPVVQVLPATKEGDKFKTVLPLTADQLVFKDGPSQVGPRAPDRHRPDTSTFDSGL